MDSWWEDSGFRVERRFLLATIAGSTVALAGCPLGRDTSDNSDRGLQGTGSGPGAANSTGTETTPEIDVSVENAVIGSWSPGFDSVDSEDDIPVEQHATVTVETGASSVSAALNGEEDLELEGGEVSIPPTKLAEGENTVTVQTPDTDQEVEETVQKEVPDAYRAEITKNGQPVDNYDTAYIFDNHTYDSEDFHRTRQEDWVEELAYDSLIGRMENDARIDGQDNNYPNSNIGWDNPNVEDPDHGHWDLQSFQQASDMKKILEWVQPAIGEWVNRNEEGAPSIHNSHYAATAELGINQLHPEKNNVVGSAINTTAEPGSTIENHGVTVIYDGDEQNYWLMDTVSNQVMQLEEALSRDEPIDKFSEKGQYNPIIDGLSDDVEAEYDIGRDTMRRTAAGMVEGFVNPGVTQNDPGEEEIDYDFGATWMDDEYLSSVIEGMQDGEPLEELIEPQKHASSIHYETGEEVGIKGPVGEAEVFAGRESQL